MGSDTHRFTVFGSLCIAFWIDSGHEFSIADPLDIIQAGMHVGNRFRGGSLRTKRKTGSQGQDTPDATSCQATFQQLLGDGILALAMAAATLYLSLGILGRIHASSFSVFRTQNRAVQNAVVGEAGLCLLR